MQILVANGVVTLTYAGTITDRKDGLLGLNCSYSGVVAGDNPDRRIHDICIGVGSIAQLQWMDETGKPL